MLHYGMERSEGPRRIERRRADSVALVQADLLESQVVRNREEHPRLDRLDALVNNSVDFLPTPVGEMTQATGTAYGGESPGAVFLSQPRPHLKKTGGAIVNITTPPTGAQELCITRSQSGPRGPQRSLAASSRRGAREGWRPAQSLAEDGSWTTSRAALVSHILRRTGDPTTCRAVTIDREALVTGRYRRGRSRDQPMNARENPFHRKQRFEAGKLEKRLCRLSARR